MSNPTAEPPFSNRSSAMTDDFGAHVPLTGVGEEGEFENDFKGTVGGVFGNAPTLGDSGNRMSAGLREDSELLKGMAEVPTDHGIVKVSVNEEEGKTKEEDTQGVMNLSSKNLSLLMGENSAGNLDMQSIGSTQSALAAFERGGATDRASKGEGSEEGVLYNSNVADLKYYETASQNSAANDPRVVQSYELRSDPGEGVTTGTKSNGGIDTSKNNVAKVPKTKIKIDVQSFLEESATELGDNSKSLTELSLSKEEGEDDSSSKSADAKKDLAGSFSANSALDMSMGSSVLVTGSRLDLETLDGREVERKESTEIPKRSNSVDEEHKQLSKNLKSESDVAPSKLKFVLPRQIEKSTRVWLKEQNLIKDRPINEVVVNSKSLLKISVTVKKNHLLSWFFGTKDKDIAFGVGFKPREELEGEYQKNPDGSIPILPIFHNQSHIRPVVGCHLAPCDGVYVLTWDNTFSLLTSKLLYYKLTTKSLRKKKRNNA
eukprot:Nk52_evm26s554 gene=Nk52_evmTU26s554